MKKKLQYKTKVALLPHFVGMHYIPVPKKIIQALGRKFSCRLFCKVNKKVEFQCGIMALGKGAGYIMLSKKRMKELEVLAGSPIQVELKKDFSKYGMDVCEELQEVLAQDSEATKRFDNLKPGKQRNIIHYVGSVKNQDKRIERALSIMENLKLCTPNKETMLQLLGIKE